MRQLLGWFSAIVVALVIIFAVAMVAVGIASLRDDVTVLEERSSALDAGVLIPIENDIGTLQENDLRIHDSLNTLAVAFNEFFELQAARWKALNVILLDFQTRLTRLERLVDTEPSIETLYVPIGYGVATWYGDTGFPTGVTNKGLVCVDPVINEPVPARVDDVHFGVAAPRWIPECANLLVCRVGEQVCVRVVNVDARAKDSKTVDYLDLWPGPAAELGFGPMFGEEDAGVIDIVWFIGR